MINSGTMLCLTARRLSPSGAAYPHPRLLNGTMDSLITSSTCTATHLRSPTANSRHHELLRHGTTHCSQKVISPQRRWLRHSVYIVIVTEQQKQQQHQCSFDSRRPECTSQSEPCAKIMSHRADLSWPAWGHRHRLLRFAAGRSPARCRLRAALGAIATVLEPDGLAAAAAAVALWRTLLQGGCSSRLRRRRQAGTGGPVPNALLCRHAVRQTCTFHAKMMLPCTLCRQCDECGIQVHNKCRRNRHAYINNPEGAGHTGHTKRQQAGGLT